MSLLYRLNDTHQLSSRGSVLLASNPIGEQSVYTEPSMYISHGDTGASDCQRAQFQLRHNIAIVSLLMHSCYVVENSERDHPHG